MKEGEGREVRKEGRNRMNSRFSERLTPRTPQSLAQGRGAERWGEEHRGRPEPREGWGRRPGRQTADQGAQDLLPQPRVPLPRLEGRAGRDLHPHSLAPEPTRAVRHRLVVTGRQTDGNALLGVSHTTEEEAGQEGGEGPVPSGV